MSPVATSTGEIWYCNYTLKDGPAITSAVWEVLDPNQMKFQLLLLNKDMEKMKAALYCFFFPPTILLYCAETTDVFKLNSYCCSVHMAHTIL